MPPTRNRFLDVLKGFLITTVVWGHVLQYLYYKGGSKFFADPIFQAIYMWHMPLFIAVSGYLSWNGIKRTSLQKLAWSRFRSYIIPIFAWTLIFDLCQLCLHRVTTLRQFATYVDHEGFGGFWFLWALYLCTLVTAVAHFAAGKFRAAYVIIPALALFAPPVWQFTMMKYVLPFFLLGCLVAQWGVPVFLKQNRVSVLLALIVTTIVCFRAWQGDTYIYLSGFVFEPYSYVNLVLRTTSALCCSLAVLLSLWMLWARTPEWLNHALELLGQNSIYIYLLQGYFLANARGLLGRLGDPAFNLNIYGRGAASLAVTLLLCGALSLFCSVLARSPILSLLLFGKRKL